MMSLVLWIYKFTSQKVWFMALLCSALTNWNHYSFLVHINMITYSFGFSSCRHTDPCSNTCFYFCVPNIFYLLHTASHLLVAKAGVIQTFILAATYNTILHGTEIKSPHNRFAWNMNTRVTGATQERYQKYNPNFVPNTKWKNIIKRIEICTYDQTAFTTDRQWQLIRMRRALRCWWRHEVVHSSRKLFVERRNIAENLFL